MKKKRSAGAVRQYSTSMEAEQLYNLWRDCLIDPMWLSLSPENQTRWRAFFIAAGDYFESQAD